ncbi:TldD/PmbA family protein [Vibrio sp. SM6]|uniref:TldD/PmbA family protein n=1 Tax=Vibrio agarilyticus TaxID=2726741 RepID=A0A7X8TP07_9VIBR|nr:TldD/PmbA family protein [Vibrio agarilyticus]NLS12154.1 TldD/PmbA family protein [Vibrio agarilyticus]
MSQTSPILNAIEWVLERATQLGAEADVVATQSSSLSLKANQGELDEYKVTSDQALGVRVIKEGRVATSYSESLDEHSLEAMMTSAIESARFAKLDATQTIAAQDQQWNTDVAEIAQPDDSDIDSKIALALTLEGELLKQPFVTRSPYNGYGDSESLRLIANTSGTLCHHFERSFSAYAYALCEHQGKQSMAGGMSLARSFAKLDTDYCVNYGANLARDLLDGAPVATGQYAVIFDIKALASLFGAFSSAFSGVSAMKATNPWRDKLGQMVADSQLTLCDVSYMPEGSRICAFDGEGFATSDSVLIQEGQLQTFLHNSQTAAALGVANTFNGARSVKGSLEVAAKHKVISVGDNTLDQLQTGEYLELVELQGVHSGADFISGEFSFGASGFLCRDGVRCQPVRGITVAGNFYTMLQEIDGLSDILESNTMRSFFAPKIRFARLSIGGA